MYQCVQEHFPLNKKTSFLLRLRGMFYLFLSSYTCQSLYVYISLPKEQKRMKTNIVILINNNHASLTLNGTVASISILPIPIADMGIDSTFVIDQGTQQQFEAIAIRRLVRKLDWRLIPFLFLIEMVSYLNRISISK